MKRPVTFMVAGGDEGCVVNRCNGFETPRSGSGSIHGTPDVVDGPVRLASSRSALDDPPPRRHGTGYELDRGSRAR